MKLIPWKQKREGLDQIAGIEAMYDRYAPRFLGLCYRYCGNKEDAEDIMHDGFMNIIRGISRFQSRGEGSLEAWMTRIMVTTSLKYLRDHAKYRKNLVFETVGEQINTTEEDNQPYPEVSTEELLKLISELPLGYRTVFNFYVMENYSHKEIAGMLHCSENTSKTQLAKARFWLRKHILELDKSNEYGKKASSNR
ncbi:MAG: sigma-70 family RNA polymerase sigma factor [Bacteroidetes bacterium]|nr:sigma-70 family RNA polymerase sigma factor [Bacteroidota bacterium]